MRVKPKKYRLFSIMRGLLGESDDKDKIWRMICTGTDKECKLRFGECYEVLDPSDRCVAEFVPF